MAQAKPAIESLRDARLSFTRAKICAAAREVFHTHGYATATLEQIAQAAGTRRSTVYNYFRDKEEILATIAEDFGDGLVRVVARLPGPVPSRTAIDRWMLEVVSFATAERIPAELMMHLGATVDVPEALNALGGKITQALARQLPAFRQAIEPGPMQGLALARALSVQQVIGWACLHHPQRNGPVTPGDLLAVAAEIFERFVNAGAAPEGSSPKRNSREFKKWN